MTMSREQYLMTWQTDELDSVQTLILGRKVLLFFEGTSAWAGELAESDPLYHAVFQAIRDAPRNGRGEVRIRLSLRQIEPVHYYAEVMLDSSNPANTGASATEDPEGYAEHVAAKRLLRQIAKKWPDSRL